MKKIMQLLSTILLSTLLVLSQAIGLMPEALADSLEAIPVVEAVKSLSSLQPQHCASDYFHSKFADLLYVLPKGTRMDIILPEQDAETARIVITCRGGDVAACNLVATICDIRGGVGQCGGDENPRGCQCVL